MTQSAIARWSDPEVILVATNLLEDHGSMRHAIHQARLSRANVLLVHVAPPSYLRTDAHDERPSVLPRPQVRDAKANLDAMVRDFQREDIECEPILPKGLRAKQIPLLGRSQPVDRVMVATSNVTGVSRLVKGSVAVELIAALDVPARVIGDRTNPQVAGGTPLGRVLRATSFQPGSALAEVNHSQLALLHVLNTAGMSERQRKLATYKARQRLSALVPRQSRHREQPLCLVGERDPTRIIPAEAGSIFQDLLILGLSYPSVLSCLLGTSVVHRVVVESQCPVIAIKLTSATATEHFQDVVPGGRRSIRR